MSIQGAMYSSIAGLGSNGTALEVIGNNIANINTPAFKASRTEFADILAKSLGGGFSIGRGATVTDVLMIFAQGSFQSTSNVTDVALEGKGFFMVRNPETAAIQYTRAGNFMLDSQGYITTSTGARVQGFLLDDLGIYTGVPVDMKIPTAPLQPKMTGDGSTPGSGVAIAANLDVNEATIAGGFNLADIPNSTNFTTSITVYDSLGNGHQVSCYFTKTAASTWEWNVVVDAADTASGVTEAQANGVITFDSNGRLDTETTVTNQFNFTGGATPNQVISFDFGDSITTDGGTGLDGSTQFGSISALNYQSQDGYGPAYLQSLDIDQSGIVLGQYANGETKQFFQFAIASFQNPTGLSNQGNNFFGQSETSGEPLLSVANVSGNGRVYSNTLEMSNVDLAEQFVNMIATQRGFQASSRNITTSDDMLNELVNLKR